MTGEDTYYIFARGTYKVGRKGLYTLEFTNIWYVLLY